MRIRIQTNIYLAWRKERFLGTRIIKKTFMQFDNGLVKERLAVILEYTWD
jgi:hypothetical protein